MNLKTEPLLECDSCDFKMTDMPEWEIICMGDIIEYTSHRGFNDITHVVRNSSGKFYEKSGNSTYIYIDNKKNKRYRIRNLDTGKNAAMLLAKFHNSAEGFSKEAVKVNVLWGRKMSRMKKMTSCLERYCDYLEENKQHNEFERSTIYFIDDFMLRSKKAVKILTSQGGIRRLEESMNLKEICINNISANTFGKVNESIIIQDIYHLGYNMAEEDIALLIKKVIESTKSKESFDGIIKAYKSIRKLNSDSIDIIKALVSFPFDSDKIIMKYLNGAQSGKELIDKFKKYSAKESLTNILEV